MNTSNEWQTFFNGYAPHYNDEVFTKNTVAEVAFLCEELALEVDSAILDIGCGTGRHSVGLAQRGYRVTGVDISEGMLAEARALAAQAGVRVEFVQSNIVHFVLGRQYDAAICLCEGALGLLGSEDDPYRRDELVLGKVYQALKGGGKFVVNALNGCRLIRILSDVDVREGRFDPVAMTEHHQMEYDTPEGKQAVQVRERVYTPAEFVGMLKRCGFEIEHVWGGTAGAWNRQPMLLDEMELMVVAHKLHASD